MRASLFAAFVAVAVLGATCASAAAPAKPEACPVFTIKAKPPAKGETSATFVVEGPVMDVTYNWAVSAGTIISGQGTSTIMVDLRSPQSPTITAIVDIGGLDPACPQERTSLEATAPTS